MAVLIALNFSAISAPNPIDQEGQANTRSWPFDVDDVLATLHSPVRRTYRLFGGLARRRGYAWATIDHYAEELGRSKRTIQRHFAVLKEVGLVHRDPRGLVPFFDPKMARKCRENVTPYKELVTPYGETERETSTSASDPALTAAPLPHVDALVSQTKMAPRIARRFANVPPERVFAWIAWIACHADQVLNPAGYAFRVLSAGAEPPRDRAAERREAHYSAILADEMRRAAARAAPVADVDPAAIGRARALAGSWAVRR